MYMVQASFNVKWKWFRAFVASFVNLAMCPTKANAVLILGTHK
jgi:hypothetical protein